METTYQHISGEDHSKKAEIEFDLREPDDDSSTLTPNLCPKCGEPLPPDAKACYCGVIITPDAADVKEQVETDTYHDKGEADGDKEDALDELRALVNKNPELIERLTELSND